MDEGLSVEEIDELAEAFGQGPEAGQLLAEIGVARGSQPSFAQRSARVFWGEVDRDLNDLVVDGVAKLLAAASRRRPENPVFRAGLARRGRRPAPHDADASPPVTMVPIPTRMPVARPALAEEVIDALCAPRAEPVALTTRTLRGAAGFGKTTLAQMIGRDPAVIDAFPDGVLWVTLGPNLRQDKLGAKVPPLARALGESSPRVSADQVDVALAQLLGDRRLLLVVDDVWASSHLAPFLAGSPRCARLVTTRQVSAMLDGMRDVRVAEMEPAESRQLLLSDLGELTEDGERAVGRLLRRIDGWPLLLSLVNGAVHRYRGPAGSVEAALGQAAEILDQFGATAFDGRTPGDVSVRATLRLSLDALRQAGDEEAFARYRELAVFRRRTFVSYARLRGYWSRCADRELTDAEVWRLCDLFDGMSLIAHEPARARIQLHPLVVDALAGDLDARTLHDLGAALTASEPGLDELLDAAT
jgi:hypothetical protein